MTFLMPILSNFYALKTHKILILKRQPIKDFNTFFTYKVTQQTISVAYLFK